MNLPQEQPAGAPGAVRAEKIPVQLKTFAALGETEALGAQQSSKAELMVAQLDQNTPVDTQKMGGSEMQSGVAASHAESRALRQSSLVDVGVSVRDSAFPGLLLSSGEGDKFLRQADRTAAKASIFSGGSGVEGVWGQHALPAGARTDAPTVVGDISMLAPESMVAETVSYWVTQGVQNAQLKLDGFGGTPVEVSILLKGDTAQIDFRTDQPEIRQILEGAVSQLKDMLSSEGLVLSGVSVGSSGQEGAAGQQQGNRPQSRQTTILTKEAGSAEPTQHVKQSGSRAVDLFV